MRHRRKSLAERAIEMVPVLAVISVGILGVFIAMNVLATAPPALIGGSPSSSPSQDPFPASPSQMAYGSQPVSSSFPIASLPAHGPTFVRTAILEADPRGIWAVNLLYPAFVVGTTPWAQQIDTDIRGEMRTMADQWEQGPAAIRQVAGKVNKLTGSFTRELLTPALASFTLTWTDDSYTSAPKINVETLNYDLATGQRINFDDLFIDPTVALDIISGDAPTLLKQELGAGYDPVLIVKGTTSLPSNYLHWAVTTAGLKITFSQSQVTQSAGDLPSIVVPWRDLRVAMVDTGPVAKLAGL